MQFNWGMKWGMHLAIHKLSDRKVKTAPPGKHEDGGGLRLVVSPAGSRRWVLRYTINRKRREMGLGPYPVVTLRQARDLALDYRRDAREGKDPIFSRREPTTAIPTFTSCAAMLIRSKRSGWKNKKHARQWVSTLKTYARPAFGHKPIDQITTDDVLSALKPIWQTKTETASRVRSRIENVIDFATAKKYRTGANPAQWCGHLDKLLVSPKTITKVNHHPALPYKELPAFYNSLSGETSLSAQALKLKILTATRTAELIEATWVEIDLSEKIWTVPAQRMKAKKEHRVPLSPEAINLLNKLPRMQNNPFLFPGKKGMPLSKMAMLQFMRKRGYGAKGSNGNAVPHGFRSTFKDWASEESGFDRETSEMALAHTIENKVEAAYRRGDLFEKRRQLMQSWAQYVHGNPL